MAVRTRGGCGQAATLAGGLSDRGKMHTANYSVLYTGAKAMGSARSIATRELKRSAIESATR